MKNKPLPKSLARQGMVTVTDNLSPGAWINVSKAFFLVFRPEVEIWLKQKKMNQPVHRK